jgi:hypothetical protein
LATPNYCYEKRQKELANTKKKEEKLTEKAQRKAGEGGPEGQQDEPGQAAEGTPA